MADKDSFWCAKNVRLNAGENLKQGRELLGESARGGDHTYAPILPLPPGAKLTGVPPSIKPPKSTKGSV